jgi:hypothetical protein
MHPAPHGEMTEPSTVLKVMYQRNACKGRTDIVEMLQFQQGEQAASFA